MWSRARHVQHPVLLKAVEGRRLQLLIIVHLLKRRAARVLQLLLARVAERRVQTACREGGERYIILTAGGSTTITTTPTTTPTTITNDIII